MPSDPTPAAIAARLSPAQRRALLWLHTTPHTKAGWTVQGKPVSKEPWEQWSHLHLSGKGGSILIEKDDMAALNGLIRVSHERDKCWEPNDLGLRVRAALEQEGKGDE